MSITVVPQKVDSEQIMDALRRREQQESLYIILDGTLSSKMHSLPPYPEDREFLLSDTPFAHMLGDGPLLFKITTDSSWLLWMQSPIAHNAACLLTSPMERHVVSKHLKSLCMATVPNAAKPLLFRFYDPRNLETLLLSFTENESTSFLAPVTFLTWIDPQESKSTLGTPKNWIAVQNLKISSSCLQEPWVLSAASLSAMQKSVSDRIVQQVIERVARYDDTRRELRLLGKSGAVSLAEIAISEANEFGITHANEYSQHLKWMLRFGQYFSFDPQYPWTSLGSEKENAVDHWNRMHAMAAECYDSTYEDNYRCHAYFAKRLWLLQYKEMEVVRSDDDILRALSRLWPERYAALDAAGLRRMLRRAEEDAVAWHMEQPYGWAILCGLYFICGVDALTATARYPWLVKIRETMMGVLPGTRSAWLFGKLRRRVNFIYHPYRYSSGIERKQVRFFARRRCVARLLSLSVDQLTQEKDALVFYKRIYPEQYERVRAARLHTVARDSILIARQVVEKYNVVPLLPFISFLFFTYFLRNRRYSTELEQYPFIDRFAVEQKIDFIEPKIRTQEILAMLKERYVTIGPPARPEWPECDVYVSIFAQVE